MIEDYFADKSNYNRLSCRKLRVYRNCMYPLLEYEQLGILCKFKTHVSAFIFFGRITINLTESDLRFQKEIHLHNLHFKRKKNMEIAVLQNCDTAESLLTFFTSSLNKIKLCKIKRQ